MKNNYSFSSLKHFLKALVFALAFVAFGSKAFANPTDAPVWHYDLCTGYFKITINTQNIGCSTCDDDNLNWGRLYYKNTSGSWVLFHSFDWYTWGGLSYFNGTVGGEYEIRGDVYSYDVTLYDRPADAKYPLEFKYHYNWSNEQGQTDATDDGDYYSPVQYYQTIEKPTGLIASTDECGQVSLSWDNPFQT